MFSLRANSVLVSVLVLTSVSFAGEWPKSMDIYCGKTPTIDGVIDTNEYDDAVAFAGVDGWTSQFAPVTDPNDYSIRGWAMHDGQNLYFAFDVTDDVLYGIDTPRWLPDENPKANELTRQGFPWFGDGIELMINALNEWAQEDGQKNSGNGSSWQIVCNATKSRLGGIGKGGLLEGEERSFESAWRTYQKWIINGDMKSAVRIKDNKKGYIVEWMIKANPCLEIKPDQFWDTNLGTVKMGFNIGVQDIDEREKGRGNFCNFHHENWWAGEKGKRTWLKQWGTLVIHPGKKPLKVLGAPSAKNGNPKKDFVIKHGYGI